MIKSFLLWSSLVISTLLSASFFFSLGEDPISGGILASLGVIFEGVKAYSWSRVGGKRMSYLWLGVPCTALSLAASVGYASLTLERGWSESDEAVRKSSIGRADRDLFDREEASLLDAISKLPPGWTTSTLRLSERLDEVRNAKAQTEGETGSSKETVATTTLAASLGRRFGIDGAWVVTLLLLAIATLLEVGIVVLALDRDTNRHTDASPKVRSDAERFLSVAVGPEGKLLGRRRLVELGWSEKEIREHVTTLLQSGVLTHQGRGSPIRLAENTS